MMRGLTDSFMAGTSPVRGQTPPSLTKQEKRDAATYGRFFSNLSDLMEISNHQQEDLFEETQELLEQVKLLVGANDKTTLLLTSIDKTNASMSKMTYTGTNNIVSTIDDNFSRLFEANARSQSSLMDALYDNRPPRYALLEDLDQFWRWGKEAFTEAMSGVLGALTGSREEYSSDASNTANELVPVQTEILERMEHQNRVVGFGEREREFWEKYTKDMLAAEEATRESIEDEANRNERERSKTSGLFDSLLDFFIAAPWLKNVLKFAASWIGKSIGAAGKFWKGVATSIAKPLGKIGNAVLSKASSIGSAAWQGVKNSAFVQRTGELASRAGSWVASKTGQILPKLSGLAKGSGKFLGEVAGFVGNAVKGIFGAVFNKAAFKVVGGLIGKIFTRLIPGLGWAMLAKDILGWILPDSWIKAISTFFEPITSTLKSIGGFLRESVDDIFNWLGEHVPFLKGMFDNVKKIFSGVFDILEGIFTLEWEPMWEGIKKIFGALWDGVKGLFSWVTDFFDSGEASAEKLSTQADKLIEKRMDKIDTKLAQAEQRIDSRSKVMPMPDVSKYNYRTKETNVSVAPPQVNLTVPQQSTAQTVPGLSNTRTSSDDFGLNHLNMGGVS